MSRRALTLLAMANLAAHAAFLAAYFAAALACASSCHVPYPPQLPKGNLIGAKPLG